MKPRRVVVILEVTTDHSLKWLRNASAWVGAFDLGNLPEIHQVQVNVVKARPKQKKKRVC